MSYELATSTHLRYDKTEKVPFLKGVERIINAGFKNLDFNFLDMADRPNRFLGDDYKEYMYECQEFAEARGAKWVQAHSVCTGIQDDYDRFMKYVKRSIECCSYLGIKWTVMHHVPDPKLSVGSNINPLDFNLKLFGELLETAEKYNVGIAIENGDYPFNSGGDITKTTEDLIELIDGLDSKYAGACWDIVHGNLLAVVDGANPVQSVHFKMLGNRLKALHVHDNNAKMPGINAGIKINGTKINPLVAFDEHIQPFMGTVDWDDVIEGLDAIGYGGYFSYEAHSAINRLPEEVVDSGLKHLYNVGCALINKSKLK